MDMRPILICTLALTGATAAAQQRPQLWVEQTGRGADVRAVIAATESCPAVLADAHPLQLEERKAEADPSFPVKACGVAVPAGTKALSFDGRPLPLLKAKLERIVVIGDTGCRRSDKELQDCETDWPFAKIVRFAADKHPDLVIHVGDYYYRETCPGGEKHCENWQNWRKDFFAPAAPLLEAAPWVLARGNHEMCGRAAEGWFRFLDAGAAPLSCSGAAPVDAAPFAVKLPGLTLAVVDSANTPEAWTAGQRIAQYAPEVKTVTTGARSPVWIVTHKPPYTGGLYGKGPDGPETVDDASLAEVEMVVAGHIHMFGSLSFGDSRPVELIVGDSGTALLKPVVQLDKLEALGDPAGMLQGNLDIDGKTADYSGRGRFGYMVLDRTAKGWSGTLHGVDDEVLARCTLLERTMVCKPGTVAKP